MEERLKEGPKRDLGVFGEEAKFYTAFSSVFFFLGLYELSCQISAFVKRNVYSW